MTDAQIPRALGVILDGNRRYARERGLPTLEGHRAGFEKVKELMQFTRERGIGTVYIYAFSTENWNRAPEEVAYLMALFADAFSGPLIDDLFAHQERIVFLGDRSRVPPELAKRMQEAEDRTQKGESGTLAVCLSYGGRTEIVAAANRLIAAGKPIEHEEEFAAALWSAGLPDPDLIIRTGGDERLSNFLTWQSAYSELYFTPTTWPAFGREEFEAALDAFASRERRHGR